MLVGIVQDKEATKTIVEEYWDDWYIKGLSEFIEIPNLTPMVDETYATNGLLEKAMDQVHSYVEKIDIKGVERKIFHPEGTNPLIVYKIEGTCPNPRNIMIYGHLDKQPYEEPWDADLHPTKAVLKNGRLYGRGASDDGYALFSTMLAIKAAQLQGKLLPRICLVLETEEESGSEHLIELLQLAEPYLGKPDCLFCMDSGVLDYEQLWVTSSLRGCAMVDFTVSCATGGYHSGEVGGIVPETFRILREILDRIDDTKTGRVCDLF